MEAGHKQNKRTYRPGISVVMSAYNEEDVIRDCLESVRGWATEIVVVNGSSRDRTEEIARGYADQVLTTSNKLMLNVNKNLAIDAASCEWILLLDPDERVSSELAREIEAVVAGGASGCAGYWMPRRNYELGRWIRGMGLYPNEQLRLFRNGAARFPCRHIHEMVEVDGPVGHLRGDLIHKPRQAISQYVHKRNLYSEHRAAFLYEQGVPFRLRDLIARPLYAFAKQYVLKGGWREGVPGLVIGVSGAYGTFLQDAKLWQKWQEGRAVHHVDGAEAFLPYLGDDSANTAMRAKTGQESRIGQAGALSERSPAGESAEQSSPDPRESGSGAAAAGDR